MRRPRVRLNPIAYDIDIYHIDVVEKQEKFYGVISIDKTPRSYIVQSLGEVRFMAAYEWCTDIIAKLQRGEEVRTEKRSLSAIL